ncbi:hypothetical protein WN73_04025 [Bradyrhizobium sp. CCBAU 45394]|uniref:hypothetical protein n=1 Tax=Bradyrhizobium sp. CCBAU 45394 TaxID=1325087 RepID=UPI0023020520|nr:hypothetical protein [Bradyrhizobium sp. CCBAU 45394]MDA9389909.1 hypothetical protein [Bradyrhizobium sp. CCBAU 45394]
MTLQDFIVAVREEGIGVSFEHRFQEMQCTKSIGQKDPASLVETRRSRRGALDMTDKGRCFGTNA